MLRPRQGRRNVRERGRPPHLPQDTQIDDLGRAPELGRILALRLPQESGQLIGLAARGAGYDASR